MHVTLIKICPMAKDVFSRIIEDAQGLNNCVCNTHMLVRRYLSNRERILLHLSSYSGKLNYYNAPYALTQDGIAEAIGIGRNNVPREIKTLMENGLIEAHKARVPGLRNRRTVYVLTTRGAVEAGKIRERVENLKVTVCPSLGEGEKIILKNISEKYGIDPISAAINLNKDLRIDLISLVRKKGKRVHYIEENYRLSRFYGRTGEIATLKNWLNDSKNIMVISGMPGIGKTTLLLKFVEDSLKDRDVFFIKIDGMMGSMDLVHQLSKFMSSIGFPKLERHIHFQSKSLEGEINWNIIFSIIREGIGDAVYIFDNIEEASSEVRSFLREFLKNMEYDRNFKIILVGGGGQNIVPYNLMSRTENMHVGELDMESAYSMLIDEGVSEKQARKIIKKYGGNPLLLALAKSNNQNIVRDYILDGILAGLNEGEREAVEIMSVFRKPVEIRMLLLNNVEFSTIYSLINKNIFQELENEVISLHRVVRTFVYEQLAEEKRRMFHLKAAEYALQKGDTIEAVYHYMEAGKVLKATLLLGEHYRAYMLENPGKIRRIAEKLLSHREQEVPKWILHEIIGDTYKQVGDWSRALSHYESALECVRGNDIFMKSKISIKMAEMLGKMGKVEEAMRLLQNVLSDKMHISRKECLAAVHYILGNLYLSRGNTDDAEANFMYALRYAESSADYRTLGYTYNGLGILHRRIGEYDRALDYLKNAYEYLEAVEDKRGVIIVLNNIGAVYYDKYSLEAEKYLKRALNMAESIGDKWNMCHAHHRLGNLYLFNDKINLAEKHLNIAEDIAEQHGYVSLQVYINISLGDLYAYTNNPEKAMYHFDRAASVATKLNNRYALKIVAQEAIKAFAEYKDVNTDKFKRILEELSGEERREEVFL